MGEIAARQAILHAVIAAVLVEALLRVWKIRAPEWRLAFWLVALACPFLLLPALLIAAPFRTGDAFAAGRALFSSQRWADVGIGGVRADAFAFTVLAALGLLLFLRDAVPMAIAVLRERRDEALAAVDRTGVASLVADAARASGVRPPAVTVLRADAPVLFVHGLWRYTLACSDGTLAALSCEEQRAVLAHELAHVRHRDPLAGWLLMLGRFVMCWNPAVQLIGRAIAQEMEHRADRGAARVSSEASFVSALRRLAVPGDEPAAPARRARTLAVLARRLHRAHIEARVKALAERADPPRFGRARLVLVAATLAVLLFFVV